MLGHRLLVKQNQRTSILNNCALISMKFFGKFIQNLKIT